MVRSKKKKKKSSTPSKRRLNEGNPPSVIEKSGVTEKVGPIESNGHETPIVSSPEQDEAGKRPVTHDKPEALDIDDDGHDEDDAGQGKKRFRAFMAFASLASVLVYINSLPGEFTFNTLSPIVNNESIRALTNIPGFFLSPLSEPSPMAATTFALDHALWGLKPWGFRGVNILLHAVCSVLVGVFALKSSLLDRRGAAVAAIVFALHPVHTEAIAGIVGRGEILATIFTLLSLRFFLEDKGPGFYAASLMLFALALLSSRAALALPLAMLMYSLFLPGQRGPEKRLWRIAPYFVFSLLYIGLYLSKAPGSLLAAQTLPVALMTALKVSGLYIIKLVLPLSLDAGYYFTPPTELLSPDVILPFQALLVLVITAAFSLRLSPRLSFSLIFILLGLLPFMHLLPQVSLMKEAYLYLPSVGLCLLAGLLFEEIAKQKSIRWAGSLAMAPLLLFSLLIFQRNSVWKDDLTLLRDIVRKSPGNALTHYNLGVSYDNTGMLEEALTEYETAIDLNPELADAYYNAACVYARVGDVEMGMKALKWAVARGFRNIELIRTDPDLDNLRSNWAFEDVLKKAETGEAPH